MVGSRWDHRDDGIVEKDVVNEESPDSGSCFEEWIHNG